MTRTIEFLNANQYIRYPLMDDADLTYPGLGALPNSFLLDFSAEVSVPVSCGPMVLQALEVLADRSGVDVTFQLGAIPLVLTVPAAAQWPYRVQGQIMAGSVVGQYSIVFGPGVKVVAADAPIGAVTLTGNPEVLPVLLVQSPDSRLDSIAAPGDPVLAGSVRVTPGYNCDVVLSSNSMKLQAGLGYGAGQQCLAPVQVMCDNLFRWFCGVHASEDGNVELAGGPGVTVVPDPVNPNTVMIKGSVVLDSQECG